MLLSLFVATNAFAWGPDGHRAVARVAQSRLKPSAQAAIRMLLGNQTLVDVAVWADEVRNTTHTNTYNWHFSDVPITAPGFLRSRDCRPNVEKGDCSVAALERLTAVLRDPKKSATQRQEALKFIVHFIGDIHQPLHAAERNHDQGGNLVMVMLNGESVRLHSAWDSGVIGAFHLNDVSLAQRAEQWLGTQSESDIAGGSFEDWTNESHRIARDVVYKQAGDGVISAAERAEALSIIQKRIARAGVRLAAVLNQIFESSGE
jgi:hypothetical protein